MKQTNSNGRGLFHHGYMRVTDCCKVSCANSSAMTQQSKDEFSSNCFGSSVQWMARRPNAHFPNIYCRFAYTIGSIFGETVACVYMTMQDPFKEKLGWVRIKPLFNYVNWILSRRFVNPIMMRIVLLIIIIRRRRRRRRRRRIWTFLLALCLWLKALHELQWLHDTMFNKD